jgi:lactate permease
MTWAQVYDPLNNTTLSTLCAAIPILVLLGLASALVVAILVFGMPAEIAFSTALYGAAYGLLPIGWIVLNVIFLYQLSNDRGHFTIMRDSITAVTRDRRLQLLLVAFSFGAFFEGASGFGTPVAVTGAMLIGLGFTPLAASGLSLIANTAPVAYGALGTPLIALQGVTALDLYDLSAMVGRQLPVFSIIVPFWLIAAFAGFGGMAAVWPAILVAGVAFAVPQFLISNFHGPWLVDVVSSVVSMAALTLWLRFWKPREVWQLPHDTAAQSAVTEHRHTTGNTIRAWLPWLILSMLVFIWGLPQVRALLDAPSTIRIPWPGLHNVISRVPPVVAAPAPEGAIYVLNWLSATGSGILVAAIIAGFVMGYSPRELVRAYWSTLKLVRFSLLTIAAMLSLGYTTRYSGMDATLGLTFALTGWLYPFFGTMLGWLGVALTGSDTSSNVLFGSLQRITAEQLDLSPTLMASANSSGGVMGKMIDAQSIVVASTATRWYGHEGDILRYVFFHSVVLACLVSLLVLLQAYVFPFTSMVVR